MKIDLMYLQGTPVFSIDNTNTKPSIYGAIYSGKLGKFLAPAFYPVHDIVLKDILAQDPAAVFTPAAQAFVASQTALATYSIPPSFNFITTPYAHQTEGLEHAYKNLRCGLFFAPGLGKCKITIDLQRLTDTRMLIITPRVMLSTWAEEFERHGNIKDVIVIDGTTKAKKLAQLKKAQTQTPIAIVMTYGVATLYPDEVEAIGYNCFVADESHRLKTPFSKRTQACTRLAQKTYRRVLLSGTPSLGSPFDLYGQLRVLGKYFCAEDWWSFRKKFGVFPDFEKNEHVPKMLLGFKNLDLMNKRVNLVCLRKTKEECLDLPDKQIIDKKFTLLNSQRTVYNNLITEKADAPGWHIAQDALLGKINSKNGIALPPHVIVNEPISMLGKLDQLASGFIYQTTKNPFLCDGCTHVYDCTANNISPYTTKCKVVTQAPTSIVNRQKDNARLEECRELLEDLLQDPANKVIVWGNYHAELDDIESAVAGVKYVRVDGGTKTEDLGKFQNAFNTDPEVRVYIGQVSTGIGITLNAANYTIYYNLPWSLEHYHQSLDRNHRIGQTRKVTVYRLIARYTLDEAKATALDQKVDFSTLVTSKTVCATCPEYFKRCAKHNIALYDTGCIYDRKMYKDIAQVKLIP